MSASIERRVTAIAPGLLLAGPAWVGLRACGLPSSAAAALAGILIVASSAWLVRRLPAALDGASRRRPVAAAAWTALWLAGTAGMLWLSPFMADPSRGDHVGLAEPFYGHHNCFTAYIRAAELARDGKPNLYLEDHYWGNGAEDPRATMGPFAVDLYEYPPPFLLPARAALEVTSEFSTLRAGWFALEALLLAAAIGGLALWIGSREGYVVAGLAPAALCSLPALGTLEVGNFQLAAYALSILAMIAFARRKDALGGGLLAFAIVSKVFPGLLLVVLISRRQWRATAWTIAFAALYCALALMWFGKAPFTAFIGYQLPRMADGSAFPFALEFWPAIAANHSIFGLVIKLRSLGVPGMSVQIAGATAWVYTVGVIAVACIWARRRHEDRLADGTLWLAVLQLAALRSPFTPDVYALVIPCWLVTLLVVRATRRGRLAAAVGWLAACVAIAALPVTSAVDGTIGETTYFILAGVTQLVGFAIVAFALRRRSDSHAIEDHVAAARGIAADQLP